MPLLSVIIPTHNGGRYIAQAIDSVCRQTFLDWELILVDDGSSDDTLHILEPYPQQDSRIRLLHREHSSGSVCAPLKMGVQAATGKYVSRIDDDDFIADDYYKKTLARLRESGADCVCTLRVPFADNKIQEDTIPPAGFDWQQVLSGQEACIQTLTAHTLSGNGFVARRNDYLKILEERSDNERCYMNSDEVDFRRFLFSLPRVAFAQTQYHYRVNNDSVTHRISPRLFERLITNNELLAFVQQHIQTDAVVQAVERECRDMLLIHENIYLRQRTQLSASARRTIRRTIRQAYHGLLQLQRTPLANAKQRLLFSSHFLFLLFSRLKYRLEKHRY